ncbi:MAG: peptidoglycan editing factor PgeF, partial [Clostridiales bacterium]
NFIFSNQTHSLNVHIASYQDKNRGLENPLPYDEIDALITDEKELALVIVHADCVPILMVDPENKIIGAAHAGWKGSAGNILQVLVDNFINHYGSKAENLLAAIGPCIGGCCYEVGADVANQFRYLQEETNDKIIIPQKGNKFLLNLPQANRRHLLNAGLQNKNIHLSGLCTQCYNDLFFSHRQQEGKRGLLASIIQIKA